MSKFTEGKEYYVKSSVTESDGRKLYRVWVLYVNSIVFVPFFGPKMKYELRLYEGRSYGNLYWNYKGDYTWYTGRYATVNSVINGESWIDDSCYGISFGRVSSENEYKEWLRNKLKNS